MNVIGDVAGRTCIIQDDIIDTAGTIEKAAQALQGERRRARARLRGARRAVGAGDRAASRRRRSSSSIVTNTIPLHGGARAACTKIVALSVARLLGQAIRSIHEETSVSSLFV